MNSTPEKSAELLSVMQEIIKIEGVPQEKRSAFQRAEEQRLTARFYALLYGPECPLAQPQVPVDHAA